MMRNRLFAAALGVGLVGLLGCNSNTVVESYSARERYLQGQAYTGSQRPGTLEQQRADANFERPLDPTNKYDQIWDISNGRLDGKYTLGTIRRVNGRLFLRGPFTVEGRGFKYSTANNEGLILAACRELIDLNGDGSYDFKEEYTGLGDKFAEGKDVSLTFTSDKIRDDLSIELFRGNERVTYEDMKFKSGFGIIKKVPTSEGLISGSYILRGYKDNPQSPEGRTLFGEVKFEVVP